MEVTPVQEGYELWRPNREKVSSKQTKVIVAFLFLLTAGLCAVITIGGWSRLSGGAPICLVYIALYVLFAFLVLRWNRGVLPVAASLSIVLAIFCFVATPTWFGRDKAGFSSPLLPESLLGLLTLLTAILQIVLIAVALIAFSQEWQVEEERPIGGGAIPPPDDFGHELDEPAPEPA